MESNFRRRLREAAENAEPNETARSFAEQGCREIAASYLEDFRAEFKFDKPRISQSDDEEKAWLCGIERDQDSAYVGTQFFMRDSGHVVVVVNAGTRDGRLFEDSREFPAITNATTLVEEFLDTSLMTCVTALKQEGMIS